MNKCANHQRRYIQSSSSLSMRQDSMEMPTIYRSADDSRGILLLIWKTRKHDGAGNAMDLRVTKVTCSVPGYNTRRPCQQVASWIPAWLWSLCRLLLDPDTWNTAGQHGRRVSQGRRKHICQQRYASGYSSSWPLTTVTSLKIHQMGSRTLHCTAVTLYMKGTFHLPTKYKEVEAGLPES